MVQEKCRAAEGAVVRCLASDVTVASPRHWLSCPVQFFREWQSSLGLRIKRRPLCDVVDASPPQHTCSCTRWRRQTNVKLPETHVPARGMLADIIHEYALKEISFKLSPSGALHISLSVQSSAS